MRRLFLALALCTSLAPAAIGQENLPASAANILDAQQQEATVYHSGWAVLDASGALSGQVVTLGSAGELRAVPNAAVELIALSGQPFGGSTDASGHFSLPGIKPGVYRLTSAGESSFSTFGVQVVAHQESSDGFSVYASNISPMKADQMLRALAVPQSAVGPAYGKLSTPAMPIVQSQRVALTNGVLNGRLAFSSGYGDPAVHTVKLLSDGQVVDTTSVNAMGMFSVKPQGAGIYDVLVGGIGQGVMSVEVVDDSVQLTSTSKGAKLVSKNANVAVQASLMVPVAMPGGGPDGQPIPAEEFAGPAPLGGGFGGPGGFSGGGGFGGGSGGGGGFGGAGGLLGIAGLAVGVAALADDDDGFNGNLATPVAP